MKKIIFLIFLLTALFSGISVYAQDVSSNTVDAGVTPTSKFLYSLDMFGENIKQGFLDIFGSDTSQINYLQERIKEREAEAKTIASEKGALSDEALGIFNKSQNYMKKIADISSQNNDSEKIKEVETSSWNYYTAYLKNVVDEMDNLSSMKDKIRNDINIARKANDKNKLADLVLQLEKAQKDENNLLTRNAQLLNDSNATYNYLENTLTDVKKAELVLQMVEQEKMLSQGASALWKKILNQLDISVKRKKLDDQISLTKKAVVSGSAEEIDSAVKDLQKLNSDTHVEINKEVTARKEKLDLADDKLIDLVKAQIKKIEKPIDQQKEVLREIPSETVKKSKLELLGYYDGLTGEVNKLTDVSFAGSGGLPPYHFQLDTGIGFPPQGLVLDTNGRLSGKPKISGTSNFGVCVVDTAGVSQCATFRMVVQPAKIVTQPVQVKVETKISISSQSSTVNKKDQYGRPRGCYADISGTASGPVGAMIYGSPISDSAMTNCGSWSSSGEGCTRSAGQPEQTNWTFRVGGSYPGSGDLSRRSVSVSASGDTKFLDLAAISCSTQ